MVETGREAPALSLPDQDGTRVTLADYAGRWCILYFYPADDTPGCTVEACEFSDHTAELATIGAAVVGVSPDDAARHREFIAKYRLRVRLLSDPTHETMRRYGAFGEKVSYGRKSVGVIRTTVLIDPHGRVAHVWPRVSAKGHAAKVAARLRELQQAGTAQA